MKSASKVTFVNLQKKYRKEGLIGYALCTDDGAMIIYHVATSREWTEKDSNSGFEFSPVEWSYSDSDSHFSEAYGLISERIARGDSEEYEGKEVVTRVLG